jgi:hypothetical protein
VIVVTADSLHSANICQRVKGYFLGQRDAIVQHCLRLVQSFLEEVGSIDLRPFSHRRRYCLYLEGSYVVVGAGCFSNIELMTKRANSGKYCWRVVDGSVNQLLEEVRAGDVDLGSAFLLDFCLRLLLKEV